MSDDKPSWNGSAVTPELLDELFPTTSAWRDAVRNAWLLSGGKASDIAEIFGPEYVDARTDDPPAVPGPK